MAAMVNLGYGCTNGFAVQKWLNSAERCILRKCCQLLRLNFRSADWFLCKPWLLVFCWSKVKMQFFVFFYQKALCTAQQNCTEFPHFCCSKGERYW